MNASPDLARRAAGVATTMGFLREKADWAKAHAAPNPNAMREPIAAKAKMVASIKKFSNFTMAVQSKARGARGVVKPWRSEVGL